MNPVFVVGVNGSGTTMLSDALGRHAALYMLPMESRVLPYFAQRYPDALLHEARVRRALADELGASRAYRHANGKQPLVLADAESLAPSFQSVAGAVYSTLASAQGKSRWGDKSPMYLQHIGLLATRFPLARFVHIYRDARDSAQSFHRRWGQEPRRTVYRWKQAIRLAREQGQSIGSARYLEVGYEALTEDNEAGMRRICAFLDLPFDSAVLESSMRWMDESTRKMAQGRMVQNSGKWRNYFSPAQIDALERIAGGMLHELGYQVTRQGDEQPSALQLVLWKRLDWGRFTFAHLKKHGLKGMESLGRRVHDALRQDKINKY
jgi:hypothetical protein